MNLNFTEDGWEDYLHWQQHDKKILKRLNGLIQATMRDPFSGPGKPEPLKFNLLGWWSRRITAEHRLVYRVEENNLYIMNCRFHYNP